MMAAEEPYSTESESPDYDIRAYEPMLVAETTIQADFDDAGSQGFRLLANYIFGNNQSRASMAMTARRGQKQGSEKIAMTAPVNQIQTQRGFLVQFTMPASYTLATLPKPNDTRVHLREIPTRKMAVSTYRGSWSQASYQQHRSELLLALKRNGIHTTGEPIFARFNSPFQLWFLRRNEIWIEVVP
jgi:hypothetical protein